MTNCVVMQYCSALMLAIYLWLQRQTDCSADVEASSWNLQVFGVKAQTVNGPA